MKKFMYVLQGYGSILDLIPEERSDAENLYSDWMSVGSYIRQAIREEGRGFGRKQGNAATRENEGRKI